MGKQLTLQDMENMIRVMELHLKDCQINGDYRQADEVKTKLINLKAIREDTEREMYLATYLKKRIQIEEAFLLQEGQLQVQLQELLVVVKSKQQHTINELNERHAAELDELKNRFISEQVAKQTTAEYLNLRKIEGHLSKQREFKKADIYQGFAQEVEELNQQKVAQDLTDRQQLLQNKLILKHQKEKELMLKKVAQMDQSTHSQHKHSVQSLQQRRNNQVAALDQGLALQLSQFDRFKSERIQKEMQKHLNEMEECQMFQKPKISRADLNVSPE